MDVKKISLVDCGGFMCDGGATFGVVPKVLWNKKYPCDDENFCSFSLRSIVIDCGSRRILVDTGTGTKQSDKFFSNNRVVNNHIMFSSLASCGYSPDDITDVLLTHLHYDHCGGAVVRDGDGTLKPSFPNAVYWCSQSQWDNYLSPNVREGSVYFPENMMPLWERGLVRFVGEGNWIPGIELRMFNGHTNGLLLPLIDYRGRKVFYTGDFVPLAASMPEAWVSAYDTFPVTSMGEKKSFLKEALDGDYVFLFQHDAYNECCSLKPGTKGVEVDRCFDFAEL
jgi:glyoxylase-like metal-dependent hydrolase (beta-lactamase superfamily II)